VCAYDADLTKIRMLASGKIPFFEPGLEDLVEREQQARRLQFVDHPANALAHADLAFIAVGTPTGPTGEADLTYVRQAARDIAAFANGSLIVVNKSTVPVETANMVERTIRAVTHNTRFCVASNPEFLREGSAIGDFLHPDRVVIGASDEQAITTLQHLYEPLGAPVLVVDVRTAEMIKYTANAFLAMKISFINEIANLCGAVEANIDEVIAGIGADARIGRAYLQPGLGFGGSCLPKDVAALASVARAHAIEPTMLEATLSVNRRQVAAALAMVEDALGDLCEQPIALAGLSYKGGTDDVRESPGIVLAQALVTRGARVLVFDPVAEQRARPLLRDKVEFYTDLYEMCSQARALVVANDDRRFTNLDWPALASTGCRHVFDFRNRLDPAQVTAAGLLYSGIGRAGRLAAAV
jgi:UDPglucose 6-dehydrogenase